MIVDTKYIRPNITVETFLAKNLFIYIYNYKGVNFKVFHTLNELNSFIESNETIPFKEFDNEAELDNFLK
jgi:hypothetical protein